MAAESAPPTLWQAVRSSEPHVLVRLAVSVVSALLLFGAAIVVGWLESLVRDKVAPVLPLLILSAIAWNAALLLIWRPFRPGAGVTRAVITTIAVFLFVPLIGRATLSISRSAPGAIELGILLVGIACILLSWISAFHGARRQQPVISGDDQVNVHCPGCGYSLVGLRDLRCPECGKTFTIDELIRAQKYEPRRGPALTAEPSAGVVGAG